VVGEIEFDEGERLLGGGGVVFRLHCDEAVAVLENLDRVDTALPDRGLQRPGTTDREARRAAIPCRDRARSDQRPPRAGQHQRVCLMTRIVFGTRTPGAVNNVTGIRCGLVVDTQRRRRRRLAESPVVATL
jgi:hypothetical protein